MPREKIDLDLKLESLSILDAHGNVDERLEPDLDDADLRRLFKAMLAARRFDERMLKLQRQGRIGTYGPCLGQEAASLGPAFAMTADDWLIPSFRETAAMLWRGWPMDKIILWWGGNEEGAKVPDGVNDLPICVPVASQVLHTGGIAFGLKLGGTRNLAIGFCGDGGTSEGDFHEGMNCAGAYQLPMIVVIQNNHWAISLPRHKQTAAKTIAQKALAYGFSGIQVDGNDILAMVSAAQEAVKKARSGGGPTLIEAVTYRLGVHTTADDPKKYRTEEEVECWKPKDPLARFWKYLKKRKVLDEKTRDVIEEEVSAQITAAIEKAEGYQADPVAPFHHCFATMPPHLESQMAEFKAYMADNGEAASNNGDGARELSRHSS